MQASGSFGGNIGPFRDPGTGQMVNATAQGTYVVQAMQPMDVQSLLSQVGVAVLQALTTVISQKLAANQVALPTIQQSLPYFKQEIAQAAGIDRLGLQLVQLDAMVNVQAPAPAVAPYTGPMPPTPMQAMANSFQQKAEERLDPRNYEVQATVNVGGFKIKGSTDGGLDTQGLQDQVVNKAKSTVIWWGIGCVVVLIAFVFLAGLGIYIWRSAVSGSSGVPAPSDEVQTVAWDGKSAYSCNSGQNVKIKGVTANLSSGTAIKANGSCQLELEDLNVTAPVCVEAIGTAKVTVKGGTYTCSQFAAKALGSSEIAFQGSKVTGKNQALGGAKITGP